MMNEQTQIEDKESSGWVPDPEPSPEKPKEFVNIKWAEIGTVVEGIYRKKKVDEEFGTTFFLDAKDGEIIYSIPGTTDLVRKLKDKKQGDIIRIEYVGNEDIGKPSPLKKFKISTWK